MIQKSVHNNQLVSIITPAYNSSNFIGECIQSVINQTYKNWELIIVDDYSSDDTSHIIDIYCNNDNRVKKISNEKNMGAAHSRNVAINESKGRFIAFLDSDDKWKEEKLAKQLDFMLSNKYEFTFTAYEIMKNNRVRSRIFSVPKKINYDQYLRNTIIGNLTVLIDREKIKDIEVEIGELEDVLTWMKYLKQGHSAYGLNENLATYRVSKGSVSNNKIKNAFRYYRCLRKKQKLSLLYSILNFILYGINATRKRIF